MKNMLNKIKGLVTPKPKQEVVSDKDKATAKGEAYIKVLDVKFDKNNPGDGYFELEWNKIFVKKLLDAGYSGSSDDEIVDAWFTGLCRQIAEDES